jgi:hypothetical protein
MEKAATIAPTSFSRSRRRFPRERVYRKMVIARLGAAENAGPYHTAPLKGPEGPFSRDRDKASQAFKSRERRARLPFFAKGDKASAPRGAANSFAWGLFRKVSEISMDDMGYGELSPELIAYLDERLQNAVTHEGVTALGAMIGVASEKGFGEALDYCARALGPRSIIALVGILGKNFIAAIRVGDDLADQYNVKDLTALLMNGVYQIISQSKANKTPLTMDMALARGLDKFVASVLTLSPSPSSPITLH